MIHSDENVVSSHTSLLNSKLSKRTELGGRGLPRKGLGGAPPKTPSNSMKHKSNQPNTVRRKALGDISNRKGATSIEHNKSAKSNAADTTLKKSTKNKSIASVKAKNVTKLLTTTKKDRKTKIPLYTISNQNTLSSSSRNQGNLVKIKHRSQDDSSKLSQDVLKELKTDTEVASQKISCSKHKQSSDIEDVELRRHADPCPWKIWFEDDDRSDISIDDCKTMKDTLEEIERSQREAYTRAREDQTKAAEKAFELQLKDLDEIANKEAVESQLFIDSHLESFVDDSIDPIYLSDVEIDNQLDLELSF